MSQPLRIFIVDDSSLYRRIIARATESMPRQTVLDTAPSGAIALKKIPAFRPDIVLLDIEMPEMNGIEVLKSIRRDYPQVTVVLVSGVNSRSADITIEGLSFGAADFIAKPTGTNLEENTAKIQRRLSEVFDLISARRLAREERAARRSQARAWPAGAALPVARSVPSIVPARVEIVGIGISTGGPRALETLLPMLGQAPSVPIVIVQHMPPLFTASLARSLDRRSAVPVYEASEGQMLEPGCIYLAPGGKHSLVKKINKEEPARLIIGLDDGPPVNSCKPAVDVLFKSLAEATGNHTLAVVMTGMGQDGLAGTAAIKDKKGYCLTQSEDTCTVYGMPQAVDQAKLSDESVPLEELAERILAITAGVSRP